MVWIRLVVGRSVGVVLVTPIDVGKTAIKEDKSIPWVCVLTIKERKQAECKDSHTCPLCSRL